MSVLAVITARGGSKGLPGKNIRPFLGKPLLVHSIEAARNCPMVTATVVTTDDPGAMDISRAAGAEVVERPPELATDGARSEDAVRHVVDRLAAQGRGYDWIILLQPTSPLRHSRHVTDSLTLAAGDGVRSVVSVVQEPHPPFKQLKIENGRLVPLFERRMLSMPRQALPPTYRPNGAIYVVRRADFLAEDNFFIDPALPYLMSADDSVDIDSELDFRYAEMIAQMRAKEPRAC